MWALSCIGTNADEPLVIWRIFDSKREAMDDCDPLQVVIPVTVTYDDGRRARKGKKR